MSSNAWAPSPCPRAGGGKAGPPPPNDPAHATEEKERDTTQPPSYPLPLGVLAQLGGALLAGQRRSFRADALACVRGLEPPLQVAGQEWIPQGGPCVLTVNHYTRPGFGAWWLALGISAVLPCEVHWVVTAAWRFEWLVTGRDGSSTAWETGRKRLERISRGLLARIAQVYGFTTMPPMPPDPAEALARARAVRQVLTYARSTPQPVIGLAPEGRDGPRGELLPPPPGAGRFLLLLAEQGLDFVPVGAGETGGVLTLRFGQPYRLSPSSADIAGLPSRERDTWAAQQVMERIATLL